MGSTGAIGGRQGIIVCTLSVSRIAQRRREGNMKLPRRQFLRLAVGAAALRAITRAARAQTYPARPVRLIVTFAAGGANDIVARLMGRWLSERLGQQFVVENRPGAGGNIGTEAVTKAAPDGYTLLIVSPANVISASLYDKLNFDIVRDLVPIAAIMRGGNVVEINPLVPANTIPEFIAYAKANPGKISMASAGIGSNAHMSGEFFKIDDRRRFGSCAISRRGIRTDGLD
jgi:tripartite-type tricarboxylate transporter receptor subunit TctC